MNWIPSQSCSMLIIAIEYNKEKVVGELLKKGANPNLANMKVRPTMVYQHSVNY